MLNTNTKTVIAFTGAFGSGCTNAAKILRDERGFQMRSLSAPIKEHWAAQSGGKAPKRNDLQRLGDQMRQEKGNDILLQLSLEKIDEEKDIVIDGIRNLGEIE